MFKRYRSATVKTQELNLIPIMNLMMVLIPFLLLGAAFYHIGVIPTSLPSHTPEGAVDPSTTRSEIVTLNLQLEKDKLVVTGSAEGLTEEETEALAAELPLEDGRYDLAGLQAHVGGIKATFPKSDTLIVVPAEHVRYQDLVDVLDVTREKITPQEGKDPLREPLFPVTVFSKLIRDEASVADASGGAK